MYLLQCYFAIIPHALMITCLIKDLKSHAICYLLKIIHNCSLDSLGHCGGLEIMSKYIFSAKSFQGAPINLED